LQRATIRANHQANGLLAHERPETAAAIRRSLMDSVVVVSGLTKTYASGFQALKSVDLQIRRGEIFALLGPNGAGKTTLIGIICGLVRPSGGSVTVDGHDIIRDYRAARAKIGLVPQELATDTFENVWDTVRFSRGLFGKSPNSAHIERVLRDLSLWDKRDSKIVALSGGMKRRVLIAKALAHEPTILFLDEPTAGVDVELRRDMWAMVRRLREHGVTIILTTHYIEEAEEMADRIGVIDHGEIVLVEDKQALLRRLGKTEVVIGLKQKLDAVPPGLRNWPLVLSGEGLVLSFMLEGEGEQENGSVANLLKRLAAMSIDFKTINMNRSSLEDIFVGLVRKRS
jgi:ABC-2 type transport system ATP-binding protein